MAKRKRLSKVRKSTNYFKPGDAKTLDQFLVASMIQGAFTAAGAVIGTILAKYLLKEVGKTVPLPESLHAVVNKEAS